ncbi:hypothetical protein TS85_11605 [Sphingomonas hengshuiensis]|uniref:Uncharacterized protein n=1 Tax=Sphingomonas hengshuiensis TaxID=1609977 RepID=A0A7U4J8N8_9SPHN|nr:hypothetical protein [Sphingomonas hengshuiensis]AJP72295.1 hypothetical protein TS85_11605 [Sphingomonas hengshuiensis]
MPGDEIGADAADDGGLILDDSALAGFAGDRGIAIGQAAGGQAGARPPFLAAPDLVRVILAIKLADQAAQPDQHGIDGAFVHRADLHPLKSQAFVDARQILHVARQAIERLHQHHVDRALARLRQQRLQPVAPHGGPARARAIGVDRDDGQPFALRIGAAERDLIVYRAIVLKLG